MRRERPLAKAIWAAHEKSWFQGLGFVVGFRAGNVHMPKAFLMRALEELGPEFGGAALASNDFGERSHKLLKRQARLTNHHL